MADNPLGQPTAYPVYYQPELLTRIPRAENRNVLGVSTNDLPFKGADIWNAYEVSCLNKKGKPMAFLGRFLFPVESANLVESKSLKLYLNSLNQERFDNAVKLAETISKDLTNAAGDTVEVSICSPDKIGLPDMPAGICLDEMDIQIDEFKVSRDILKVSDDVQFEEITDEILFTNLFRSNCPITNQPDWATVTVCYHGRKIPHEALLKYLVSYRQHNDYHENCVERIFCDLLTTFNPMALTVEANFLRRGGLDINPVRTTESGLDYLAFPRYIRQ